MPPYNAGVATKKPKTLNTKLIAIIAVIAVVVIALVLIIPNVLNGGDGGKLKIESLLSDNNTRVYNTLNNTETVKYNGSTVYVSSKELASIMKDYSDGNLKTSEFADELTDLKGDLWFYRVLDKRGNELSKSSIEGGKDVSAVSGIVYVINGDMSCAQVAKEIQNYISLDKLAVVSSSSSSFSGAGYSNKVIAQFNAYEIDDDVYSLSFYVYSLDEYSDAGDYLEDLKEEMEDLDETDYSDFYMK